MKTRIFTFILMSGLFIVQVAAQFSIAPNSGINIANNTIKNNITVERNPVNTIYGFIGFTVKYKLNQRISILNTIEYSQKGFKNIHNDPTYWFVNIRYHYIDILPTIEYMPTKYLGLYTGINYGIHLYEDFRQKDNCCTAYTSNTINKTDLGALIGIRIYYKEMFLNIQYDRSLINIGRKPNLSDGPAIEIDQRNITFQIGLGYFFKL